MALQVKIEIMSKETIKPSFPTPPDLKIFKFSLLDQFATSVYTPLILFFTAIGESANYLGQKSSISNHLKASLSKTLTHFYPLAGRVKDNLFIECLDDGVEFTEARVYCDLSDILLRPDTKELKQFLPAAIESEEAVTGCLLLVQVNFFDCGGMALGVCFSHKLADAATLSTFVRFWAAVARNSSEMASPVFVGASMFPPIEQFASMSRQSVELKQRDSTVMKRFVFDAFNIAVLKAKVASESVPNPTRVEAVSALIWKCATIASRTNLPCPEIKPSVWSVAVNLRTRFVPPLPENYIGNCLGFISSQVHDTNQLKLQNLLALIRKEIQEFSDNYAKKLQGNEALQAICGFAKEFGDMVMNEDIEFYICTSWCKYGLYNADFGWGKPVWLSTATNPFKNTVILMDTRDGEGIEAWLSLSEEDMACFESNKELLEFASVNPSVSNSE